MPGRDHVVFASAMAIGTAHLLDDGLLHPHDGVADVPSTAIAVAISVAAIALYPRLAPWARALLAGLFGLSGLVAGLDMHVIPALQDGAAGSDYTGFAHAAAGAALLALAAALALRRAPNPQPS